MADNLACGWPILNLHDIADVYAGGTPPRGRPDCFGGGIPWVKSGEVNQENLRTTEETLSETGLANSSAKWVSRGSVLVALYGATAGQVAQLDIDATTNQAVVAVVSRNDVSNKYLFYAIKQALPPLLRHCQGSGQPNLNGWMVKKLPVPVPSQAERERIVSILDAFGDAAETTQRLVVAKERLKKGLMQQLLTGKRRFPQFKGKPWRRCRIGDVLKEVRRPVDWDDDHLYRLVSVRRWAGGVFLREELRGSEIKVKKLCTIHAGDMLISHIQSAYGAMALVGDEFDGCQVSDLYTVLVPRAPREFDARFFAYLAQRRCMWHQAYLASNGFFAERLRLNFNPADFLHRLIFVPPTLEEQQAIVATLAAVDREIELLRRQLDLLKKQKRGLMQKLLTGRIRVKV